MGWFRLVIVIALLLAVSLIWEITILDPLIAALAIVLLISWLWNQYTLTGIAFRRMLSADAVNVGDTVIEEIVLQNRSWLPKLWVELTDQSTLPGHQAGMVASLGSRGSSAWQVATVARKRGKYRLGPGYLSAGDPFGLFASARHIPASYEMMVYPARINVQNIPLPTAQLDGGRASLRAHALQTSSFHSVRDYATGDPMNRIAWSATARRGALMVKEFDPDPTFDLWLLLDLNHEGQFDLHHRERTPDVYQHLNSTVEYIIAIGFSLADAALADGKKVGLILNRQEPLRLDPDNTERQWMKIAETLAVANSSGSRSMAESLMADHRKFGRTSGLVVVTADPRDDWVGAAAVLVARFVPITGVIVDAGGDGQDDVSPLVNQLAAARIRTVRYATHTSRVDGGFR